MTGGKTTRVVDLTSLFDGSVYVILKGEKDEGGVPVHATKHYGMALSLAGELGATDIHRISEGVWEGNLPGCDRIWIYRMAVRGS